MLAASLSPHVYGVQYLRIRAVCIALFFFFSFKNIFILIHSFPTVSKTPLIEMKIWYTLTLSTRYGKYLSMSQRKEIRALAMDAWMEGKGRGEVWYGMV